MRIATILFSCTVFLIMQSLSAQPRSTNKNAGLQKDIQTIAGLFKKKKKDSTTTAYAAGKDSGDKRVTKLQGGDLSPTVKYLDADQIYSFNAGGAEIRKGSSSALIDAAGNFVVPYNTYNLSSIFVAGPVGYIVRYNGMYQFANINGNWGGYINAGGRVLMTKDVKTGVTDFTDNKLLVKTNNSSAKGVTYTYYTPDGKIFNTSQLLEHVVDGIGIVRTTVDNGNKNIYVYKKLTGETISASYDDASPFSDGMARVGLKDAFGILKYGYINTTGKLVVPCMFSEVPGDFSGGFARVQPKDKSAFEYAFINKAGDIVFKQTGADVVKNGKFDHFTNYGLAFSERNVMDTTFTIVSNADFFRALGLPADSWFVQAGIYTEGEVNPKLIFSTRAARSPYTQMPVYGFINLATKKVVMPVFDFMNITGSSMYFDPVSHLAYAKVVIGKDNNNVLVYREGYINEDGLFVLVKGKGSAW